MRNWGAAFAVVALAAACARPTGDFGRAAPDVVHDHAMPAAGWLRSKLMDTPQSTFNHADEEIEMRDRVWRYLVSPHASAWFGDIISEYQRTGIAPIGPVSEEPFRIGEYVLGTPVWTDDKYYAWLKRTQFSSSHVRYQRVAEDINLDIGMMPAAFRSICNVLALDRRRGIASNDLGGEDIELTQNALRRHTENREVIDWFVRAVSLRYASYDTAVDHLLVETPHEEALAANAALSALEPYVAAARRGDFCGSSRSSKQHSPPGLAKAVDKEMDKKAATVQSRFQRTKPSEGPYLK